MLKRIICDRFPAGRQEIVFDSGLNVILGDDLGSSAIGKTTFLNIIDYAFGGKYYYSGDIHSNVGLHDVKFEFVFHGESHYFYRETAHPDSVFRCDDQWHFREEMELPHYLRFLSEQYGCLSSAHGIEDMTDHFFRIYGHGNVLEQAPFMKSTKDTDPISFLMYLFGKKTVLDSLTDKLKELNLHASDLTKKKKKDEDAEDQKIIEENEQTITSLRERYDALMSESEDYQFDYLGFDQQASKRMTALRNEVRKLTDSRDTYQAQIDAIKGSQENNLADITGEFSALSQFFPDANIQAFERIEAFHRRIREILADEAQEKIDALQQRIDRFDTEISRLKKRIKDVGLTKSMATNTVGQCVEIKLEIERLEAEIDDAQLRIEQRAARRKEEQELRRLLQEQKEAIQSVQDDMNYAMKELSDTITGGRESHAPVLSITEDKKAGFETPGNTSESSAFKGLIIYDLAVIQLSTINIPALIHDSNILARVEAEYLEAILQHYRDCGHQVFVAFEKPSAATPEARKILNDCAKLTLGSGHKKELYGWSWSKRDKGNLEQEELTGSSSISKGEYDHGSDT